jgi:hypothetical protein
MAASKALPKESSATSTAYPRALISSGICILIT